MNDCFGYSKSFIQPWKMLIIRQISDTLFTKMTVFYIFLAFMTTFGSINLRSRQLDFGCFINRWTCIILNQLRNICISLYVGRKPAFLTTFVQISRVNVAETPTKGTSADIFFCIFSISALKGWNCLFYSSIR